MRKLVLAMDVARSDGQVNITMLGSFTLKCSGRTLTDEANRSLKLWGVLAYLLLHRDRCVPQAELMEQFWPEEDGSNPANALKTLLYRVRSMLEPLFDPGTDPILSRRGGYGWNSALPCWLDLDAFSAFCRQGEDTALSAQQQLAACRQADALYRGDFLPKLSGFLWTISLSAHYRELYLRNVKTLSALLDAQECYDEIIAVCTRASELDPLDEELYLLLIRALLHQGKNTAALSRYETATEVLYRNLGVRPSEALRVLYKEIMSMEQDLETNLEVIQSDLRETAARPGAFICEYGFFKEAYRLESRRAARSGISVHVGLITVSAPDGSTPPLEVLSPTMEQLLEILSLSLRRGDVVSRYSGAQYVVLLPSANFEDSTMVMERVVSAFYRQHRRNFLKLSYKIRALD